ncbi:polysialyltransferase family glycosyltransferase [Motilimonas cestriensis]|uniref:polysialyltransferase family glycosyltransferase n=1 Tax=Motilimonas cestriensis TaxID=2742685 RepID=UPI003DA2216B
MIYFVINNNFHFIDALNHVRSLDRKDVVFICIPHTLDMTVVKESGWSSIVFESPLVKRGGCFNVFHMLKIKRRINNELTFKVNDAVFFYTEFELLNQYILKRASRNNSSCTLVEENGLATYAVNKLATPENLTRYVFERPRHIFFLLFFSLLKAMCVKTKSEILPVMEDLIISDVVYYQNVKVNRDVKVKIVKYNAGPKKNSAIKKNESESLYLSQDVYNFFMSIPEYLDHLDFVFREILKDFDVINFKFHPREVGTAIEDEIKKRFPFLHIISDNRPVEMLISDLSPALLVSFSSSALVPLKRQGWKVLFTMPYWKGHENDRLLIALAESMVEISQEPLYEIKTLKNIFD